MNALLCASDKRGLSELAGGLTALGWAIYATDGTRQDLAEGGFLIRSVAELAGAPSMLSGRLKTLHAGVFAGLLYRRGRGEDEEELASQGMEGIDLLACNFYPLPEHPSRGDPLSAIDIGGPAMVRAAAKNFGSVIVLVDPADYAIVLRSLTAADGALTGVSSETRLHLARKALAATRDYDGSIIRWLADVDPSLVDSSGVSTEEHGTCHGRAR